eukprot:Hpha_TRINITY_DN2945_c0_g1::TRINITY_DN2945_c0_g1_i1::g.19742::m.19742
MLPVWGAAAWASTKTAITALQWIKKGWDLTSVPELEELVELWHALESLTKPLEVAVLLYRRERTQPYVDDAVQITRRAVLKVEQLLERGQDIEDGRPGDEASWMRWKDKVAGSVAFRTRITSLLSKLADARQTLTLALVSSTAAVAEAERLPLSPFRWIPSVFDHSYSLLTSVKLGRYPVQGESARPLGVGTAWVSRGKADWALLGRVELLLTQESSGGDLGIITRRLKSSGLVEDEEEPEEQGSVEIPLEPATQLHRCWGDSAPASGARFASGGSDGIAVLSTDLVYFLSASSLSLAIAYEGVGKVGESEVYEKAVSAEVFEVFVGMLIHRNAIDDWQSPAQELRQRLEKDGALTFD